MARMTLDDYRIYIREWFDVDVEEMSDRLIDSWVRDAYQRIHRLVRRWPHFEQTISLDVVAGTNTYDVSALDAISTVTDGVYGALEQMEHNDARRCYQRYGQAGLTGIPEVWSQWKGLLELWPIPSTDGTVTVDGYRTALDWYNPGSSPDLPADFDMTILDWVLARAYKHEDDPELSSMSMQDFAQSVDLLLTNYMTDTSGAPLLINRRRRITHEPWPTFGGGTSSGGSGGDSGGGGDEEEPTVPTPDTTPPDVLTGVSPSAGSGSVVLTWSASTDDDLAGYRVYRSLSSGTGFLLATTTLVVVNTYTDTGRSNGTTYYYKVAAVDGSGNESTLSAEVSATPGDSTPPPVPAGLSATRGDTTVALSWTAVTNPGDLAGYFIYRSTSIGSNGSKISGTPQTATTYADTGRSNGTTYYYKVSSVDINGNESALSTQQNATPADLTPPSVPLSPSATGQDGQVALSWSASSGSPAGYFIYKSTSAGSVGTKANVTANVGTTYTVTGLTNATPYFFRITSVDAAGNESGASTQVTATPASGAPFTVVQENIGSSGSADAAVYEVTTTNPTAAGNTLIAVVVSDDTVDTAAAISAGWLLDASIANFNGHYVFRRSTGAGGDDTWTDFVPENADTPYAFYIAEVAGLAVSPVNRVSTKTDAVVTTTRGTGTTAATTVTNVWLLATIGQSGGTPTDGTFNNSFTQVTVGSGFAGTTKPSGTDVGILAATRTVTIKGGYSTTATWTTNNLGSTGILVAYAEAAESGDGADNTPPAVPTGLSATPGTSQAAVSWTAVVAGDLAGYFLYRSTVSGSGFSAVNVSPITLAAYTDSGLADGTTYYYKVTSVDTSGNESANSAQISVTPNGARFDSSTLSAVNTGLAGVGISEASLTTVGLITTSADDQIIELQNCTGINVIHDNVRIRKNKINTGFFGIRVGPSGSVIGTIIEDNDFDSTGGGTGVNQENGTGLIIRRNHFQHMENAVTITSGCAMTRNYAHHFALGTEGGQDMHVDGIEVYALATDTVLIQDNHIDIRDTDDNHETNALNVTPFFGPITSGVSIVNNRLRGGGICLALHDGPSAIGNISVLNNILSDWITASTHEGGSATGVTWTGNTDSAGNPISGG